MIKLGSHVSFKKPNYLVDAAADSFSNGANTMMIYLGAPQTTLRTAVENYQLEKYEQVFENVIAKEDIIVHAPYIVNPANPEKAEFSVDFLVKEIQRMNYIGAKYLVLHPGAYTKFSPQEALDTLVDSLKEILNQTKDVIICIETMSGKGSEIGINFEQIRYILDWVNSERVAVCLDTCHLWDAGYNLKEYQSFKDELNKWNLLEKVKVIHLNDSKNDLSSHKDRHENIGRGFIGYETLKQVVHDPDFDNIPIILETPWTEQGPIYKEEIAWLLDKK
ncbi:deoxyribonuclease IV [Mycoplasmopsis columboralis]|uniref:Probable endonuclease 4 n=1 Tax=Mycoplasmopsis columboralis TaxID=171282 RepID=A0A449B6G3_9BACT|nr:deoxyribonuclease IV [Mycoplasmopsis columboralis]VEU76197.1 putative endonuclease 4 [Mycoplasmopsis columboralis]